LPDRQRCRLRQRFLNRVRGGGWGGGGLISLYNALCPPIQGRRVGIQLRKSSYFLLLYFSNVLPAPPHSAGSVGIKIFPYRILQQTKFKKINEVEIAILTLTRR
jgi:hypothetical protein